MAPHGMTPPHTGNGDDDSGRGHDDDFDSEGGQAVATRTERKVKRPQLYRVMLHNDDYTTMEFVVLVLKSVFHHDEQAAVRIMLQVHQQGVGVAGVYSYEIAEARVAKVARLAKEHEFPLRCSMEPD